MEQAAASTCLLGSRLARGCDAQGSPGEAGPVDRLADLHQEVAKLPLESRQNFQGGGEQLSLSQLSRKFCQTADDSILVIISQAGKVGRRGVNPSGGLQSDLRQTLLPTQVPSPGSGKGNLMPFPFRPPSHFLALPVFFSVPNTQRGRVVKKLISKLMYWTCHFPSSPFCHSLFLFCLSLSFFAAAIVSHNVGIPGSALLDSAFILPTHYLQTNLETFPTPQVILGHQVPAILCLSYTRKKKNHSQLLYCFSSVHESRTEGSLRDRLGK